MSASIPSQQLPTEPSRRLPVVSWSHQVGARVADTVSWPDCTEVLRSHTWYGSVAAYCAASSLCNVEVRHEQHCDPGERKYG